MILILKKSKNLFIVILGIHAVIIYFALCLSICIIVFLGTACIMVLSVLFPLKLLLGWKGYFKICKYTFLIFEKGNKQKIVSGFLGFVSILF